MEPVKMETETNFSHDLWVVRMESYLWAVRMESYLEALDVWEAIEEDYDVPPLLNNPTMA